MGPAMHPLIVTDIRLAVTNLELRSKQSEVAPWIRTVGTCRDAAESV
jgi:hypothetical protein